ncbi:hypothetical protein RRG08_027002 [Elysia crispata]|uniref:Polypeptide N-acetylgalactosaminyltransferase n=1 Tax=Elysia crispata TaxID=231223 RepID=A0AAE1AIH3_9GAST|nr:hypothetical protein RRG08_027002 [Elysia crispata]
MEHNSRAFSRFGSRECNGYFPAAPCDMVYYPGGDHGMLVRGFNQQSHLAFTSIMAFPSRLFVSKKRTRQVIVSGLLLTLFFTVMEYFCLGLSTPEYLGYDRDSVGQKNADCGTKREAISPSISGIPLSVESKWSRKARSTQNGFQGKGLALNLTRLSEKDKLIYKIGYETHKVNQLVSDMIPLRREIPLEIPECQHFVETLRTSDLPTASIVMPMHNEMWSTLMRTVFSILDAGPYHLIQEIVFVDDASTNDGNRFGWWMSSFQHMFRGVIVVLDAHCEVHKGWLEPLLHRVQQDDRVVAIPDINEINFDTYEVSFTNSSSVAVGGLTMDMLYSWQGRRADLGRHRQAVTDPIPTPTHLGCCFAVSRRNFERLGRYDTGLKIWGCENQELSFKVWMCGGRLEIIPCSHVAHLYRKSFPYTWGKNSGFTHIQNCMRVAEVWMDDYKQFYYDRIGLTPEKVNIGSISAQKTLRSSLQCRSFHWYVQEVYPSLFAPFNSTAMGSISSRAVPASCLQMESHSSGWKKELSIQRCYAGDNRQYFVLTSTGQIRRDEECVVYSAETGSITTQWCEGIRDQSHWIYTKENMIASVSTNLIRNSHNRCMSLSHDNRSVDMKPCKRRDSRQKWHWPRK